MRHLLCDPRGTSPRVAWWLCQGPMTANIQSGVSGRGEGQPFVPRSPTLVSASHAPGQMLAPELSHCVRLSSWAALPTLRGLTNKKNFPLNDTVPSVLLGTPRVGPSCLCKWEMEDSKPVLQSGGYAWPPSDQGLLENTRACESKFNTMVLLPKMAHKTSSQPLLPGL